MINGCWSATFDANGNLVKWPYNRTHGKPPKGKVLFILNKKQTGELDRIIGKKDFVVIYGKAYDYVKNLVAKKYPKRIEMF
jgi:hypothetical protein